MKVEKELRNNFLISKLTDIGSVIFAETELVGIRDMANDAPNEEIAICKLGANAAIPSHKIADDMSEETK